MEDLNSRIKIRIPCPDGILGCAVAHYAHIPQDAYNVIHDCHVDVYNHQPTDKVIAKIYTILPKDIKDLARTWDWNDTEVGNSIYKWMEKRIIVLD